MLHISAVAQKGLVITSDGISRYPNNYFSSNSLAIHIYHLNANHAKWPNTLKQFVACCVFDHFVGLTFKGLSLDVEGLRHISS